MNSALLSGVAGLDAHQRMLDVAGNNLANVNTAAFKSSRVTFAEMLSNTIRQASQPTESAGGTNPQQIGSGVMLSTIDRNMNQGSLINTGQPLDLAIEGAGYFVLFDGEQEMYTRVGTFAVDALKRLVDPGTGHRVQRIGNEGEFDGFQRAGETDIYLPYGQALPPRATESFSYTGNLSADVAERLTKNELTSTIQYTVDEAVVGESGLLKNLDQAEDLQTGDTITISGTAKDGSTISYNYEITADGGADDSTIGDLLDAIGKGIGTKQQLQSTFDVLTAETDYIQNPTGGDQDLVVTFDDVTKAITLTAGQTLTLQELATAISAAFEGENGAVCGDFGENIATVVAIAPGQFVLQIQAEGETPNGSITDFAITAGADTIEYVDGDPVDPEDVTTATFATTQTGTGSNGFIGSSATLINGEIRLTDDEAGYSRTDLKLTYNGAGSLEFPSFFKILTAGGNASSNTNMSIYDSQGNSYPVSATFVRTDETNVWDLVLTAIGGNIAEVEDRRIEGITFLANGSYGGQGADPTTFKLAFGHDPTNMRTLSVNLGTVGKFDGVTQFGGQSTVAPSGQDGYAPGWLSSLSVTREGVLVGMFTNGIRRNLATIKMATFQNAAGLESAGSNYFLPSSNSGQAMETQGLSGGAGSVRGGSMERSNVEVAKEFVNMIQAQNGFQANARTITVANDVLRELTNLIR